MINNDRTTTYIHSLEGPESPLLEQIEKEAMDTYRPRAFLRWF